MLSCKNCNNEFEGKYCNSCGQKYIEERFTVKKTIYEATSNIFAFDSGLLYTFVGLFKNPKKVVDDYVAGATKPPVNPFKYLFLAASLSALVSIYFGVFEASGEMSGYNSGEQIEMYSSRLAQIDSALLVSSDSVTIDSLIKKKNFAENRVEGIKMQEGFLGDYMEYLKKYSQVVVWASVPFLAFFCWLFFRKSRGYNFAENTIISTFIYAQSSFIGVLLWLPLGLLGLVNVKTVLIVTLLAMAYMCYAIFRIYFKGKSLWNLFSAAAIYLLGYMSFMFALMLVVAIVVAVALIKG